MKKRIIIFLLTMFDLLIPISANCQIDYNEYWKEKEPKNSWENFNLNGTVKSVQETKYGAEQIKNKIRKKYRYYNELEGTFEYDSKIEFNQFGLLLDHFYFDGEYEMKTYRSYKVTYKNGKFPKKLQWDDYDGYYKSTQIIEYDPINPNITYNSWYKGDSLTIKNTLKIDTNHVENTITEYLNDTLHAIQITQEQNGGYRKVCKKYYREESIDSTIWEFDSLNRPTHYQSEWNANIYGSHYSYSDDSKTRFETNLKMQTNSEKEIRFRFFDDERKIIVDTTYFVDPSGSFKRLGKTQHFSTKKPYLILYENEFDRNGEEIEYSYEYEFDKIGNWRKQIIKKKGVVKYLIERKIKYYK